MGPLLAAIPAAFSAFAAGTATAAETALAFGAASTAVGVAGAGVAGYSAYKSNSFQAAVAKNNAAVAQQNETIAQEQGAQSESFSRMQTTERMGQQLASQGANGIDVGFGTPAAVRQATADMGDLEAKNIRYNTLMRSLGFQQQANSDLVEAKQSQNAAVYGAIGGALNAGGSFLSGGSSLAGKWSQMQAGYAGGVSYNNPSTKKGVY